MAQHKAPTAVTFATTEDSSDFRSFVRRYWKLAALLALAVSMVAIYATYSSEQAKQQLDASWDRLHDYAKPAEGNPVDLQGSPAELIAAEASFRGTQAGPWALWIAARKAAEDGQWEDGKQALALLRANYPTHPLIVDRQPVGADGGEGSMVDELERRFAAQATWKSTRPELFDNPPPPPDSPRVRLKTDQGEIVVALYAKDAPKHVENFLKLCREGYYSGTRFHRVVKGFMIQGGDPNSKSEDRATWGLGGPDYKVDKEENSLHHFPAYLAAAKTGGDSQSSGSQFYITTAAKLNLDGQYVVFGKVLEGTDVARKIEDGELESGSRDRPKVPVVLLTTEVL